MQYLVKFNCYFSWQAHFLIKFGLLAGAGNGVVFSIETSRGERDKQPRLRGGLWTDGFMLGSWSDRPL